MVGRDSLGPVLRVLVLTAGTTGLRQSELLGLRWRDVDGEAQRILVGGRQPGSARRLVPMPDRLALELESWRRRAVFDAGEDLVFGHPELGTPLDRTKVTRRFQAASAAAGTRVIRFHDLRHTFAITLAAAGVPLRTISEYLGHADLQTTRIYAHYARSSREVEEVNAAFSSPAAD